MNNKSLFVFLSIICFIVSGNICAAQNLIGNPGFESGSDNKPANWILVSRKKHNFIEWITDDVHSGKRAIEITAVVSEDKGKSMGIYTDFLVIPDNVRVEMSAWIKAYNIVSGGKWYKGRIVLYAFDKAKKKIKHSDIQLDGSISDWTRILGGMITPQGTNFMKVSFYLTSCTGTMWVDDVEVTVAQEAPDVSFAEIYNPVIIPHPWKITYGNGKFPIGSVAIMIDPRLGKQTHLGEEIKEFFDSIKIDYNVEFLHPGDARIENYSTQLLIGDGSHTAINNQLSAKFPNNNWQELGDQGYFLSIQKGQSQNIIYLGANTEQGRFYGFQTVKQVIKKNSEPILYPVDLLDMPTLDRRGIAMGVQWFGKSKHAITRLAELKCNFLWNQGSFLNRKFMQRWREDLTENEINDFYYYLDLCKRHFIDPYVSFGPRSFKSGNGQALHPVQYSSDDEINLVVRKMDKLYGIGFRNFGLNFDDLQNTGEDMLLIQEDEDVFGDDIGAAHSYFTQQVYNRLKALHPDITFKVLPMFYSSSNNITDVHKAYLEKFAELPAEIKLVACAGNDESVLKFAQLTERSVTVWSNFYASYKKGNSALGYLLPFPDVISWDNQDIRSILDGFIFLPSMPDYEDAALISWKTMADYMWSPERYDREGSFQRAVAQYLGVPDRPYNKHLNGR